MYIYIYAINKYMVYMQYIYRIYIWYGIYIYIYIYTIVCVTLRASRVSSLFE